ncbi:MAG: YqgE/AlgH family protein [Bacteroidaceae bacterium]|nr:YqgE/AlgH family protein [Bacteroides sp.]MBR4044852.1 YqgE/AlgH family protein [Bacteroidaceae bacterium]
MDMSIFQIESNKATPRQGSLLVSAPFLKDYHFARSVVLVVEHNDEGSMGIVMNKNFSNLMTLNELVPELASIPPIPLYKGGPVGRDTLFYLHTFSYLKDALPLGNGLYVNGDFEQMKRYILAGGETQGMVRFFMGYAGWQRGQLTQEIEANTWMVSNDSQVDLLNMYLRDLWKESLCDMGGKYAVWSRYPKYPIMN